MVTSAIDGFYATIFAYGQVRNGGGEGGYGAPSQSS